MNGMRTGQKNKRGKKKHGRMMKKEGGNKKRKEMRRERKQRAEDLLRVFPPWVEGLAGPVLAICRLAGSILTLGREEEQQEGKVKDTRR